MKSKILVALIILQTLFPVNLSNELYKNAEIFNLSVHRNIFTEATTIPNTIKLSTEPLKGLSKENKNNSWVCPYLLNVELDNEIEDEEEPIELIFD